MARKTPKLSYSPREPFDHYHQTRFSWLNRLLLLQHSLRRRMIFNINPRFLGGFTFSNIFVLYDTMRDPMKRCFISQPYSPSRYTTNRLIATFSPVLATSSFKRSAIFLLVSFTKSCARSSSTSMGFMEIICNVISFTNV